MSVSPRGDFFHTRVRSVHTGIGSRGTFCPCIFCAASTFTIRSFTVASTVKSITTSLKPSPRSTLFAPAINPFTARVVNRAFVRRFVSSLRHVTSGPTFADPAPMPRIGMPPPNFPREAGEENCASATSANVPSPPMTTSASGFSCAMCCASQVVRALPRCADQSNIRRSTGKSRRASAPISALPTKTVCGASARIVSRAMISASPRPALGLTISPTRARFIATAPRSIRARDARRFHR